jgi:uncharacterized protein YrzB (UPF0473 family)
MDDLYGSDFLTIVDEEGTEYELEVLGTFEYNGALYYAVIPANHDEDIIAHLEINILKSIEEDGESILCAVEDEQELQAVNDLLMEALYNDQDTDET